MMKSSSETHKNMELCEKIEMYLMLQEQYYSFIENGRLTIILDSYKSERKLRQIYLAYLYVVLEKLHEYEPYATFTEQIKALTSKKYNLNNKEITLKILLYNYRNKTFHKTNKDYYNQEGLYTLDLIDCSEEVKNITEILKLILEKIKNEESGKGLIKFFKSEFSKKASQMIGGDINE